MPQTVSNGNVTVVNTGSAHTAFTGGDPCLLPPGAFDNAAPSANLVPGTSASKTLIGGNPTATEGTKWDPSQSSGKVGVKSGPTQKAAEVVAGSKDMDVEGKPAARAGDTTTQNQGNSSGAVQPGALAPKAASQAERADKLCYLKSWTGVTDGGIKLGWKGGNKTGDPNYVEVWDTATIKFTATREDITQAAATNPKCERGTHTDWRASGKVFPLMLEEGKLEKQGTDAFDVPAELVVASWLNGSTLANFHLGDEAGSSYEPRVEGKKDQSAFAGASAVDAKAEGVQGKPGKAIATPDGKIRKAQDNPWNKPAPGLEVDLKNLLMWFWWWVKSPTIEVSGQACGGARTATILVLPETKLKFKYKLGEVIAKQRAADAKEARDKIEGQIPDAARDAASKQARAAKTEGAIPEAHRTGQGKHYSAQRAKLARQLDLFSSAEKKLKDLEASFETAKKILDTAEKVANVAQSPLHYRFLQGFSLGLEISYERTKETQGLFYYYTDATMGQKWVLSLNIDKVIDIDWTVYVSLLNFAGPFIGGLAQLLRNARIFRIDLFFRFELAVGVTVSIAKTEVDALSGGGAINFDPRISLGLAVGGAGLDVIRATFVIVGKGKHELRPPKSKEEKGWLVIYQPSFSVGTFYSVILFPDRWWEVKLCQGQIHALQFNIKGDPVGCFSMPS